MKYLNVNNETNIKVLMGTCDDTGITDIYYEDKDGDGLGWDINFDYIKINAINKY